MSTGTTATPSNLITFFNAATANGNSTPYNINFSKGLLIAKGTWNGATVTIFQSAPDGTYVPVSTESLTPVSFTENGAVGIDFIVNNQLMYATISGASGGTSLTVTFQRVS